MDYLEICNSSNNYTGSNDISPICRSHVFYCIQKAPFTLSASAGRLCQLCCRENALYGSERALRRFLRFTAIFSAAFRSRQNTITTNLAARSFFFYRHVPQQPVEHCMSAKPSGGCGPSNVSISTLRAANRSLFQLFC